MGFADVAPDAAKVLVVHFTHEKQAFMVTLQEQVDDFLIVCHGKYIRADMIFRKSGWSCRRAPHYQAAATLCRIGWQLSSSSSKLQI